MNENIWRDFFEESILDNLFESKFRYQKSKGIDKLSGQKFAKYKKDHFKIIERKCFDNSYEFSPYLENLRLKGRGKIPRLISIPTVRDRLVLHQLKDILHNCSPESVSKMYLNQYVHNISNLLKNKEYQYFYRTDIKKFYDEINHDILINKVRAKVSDKVIISLICKAIANSTVPLGAFVENYDNYKTTMGVPQGLSISNILAQIYLEDFDKQFEDTNYAYFRYVDDILILSKDDISKKISQQIRKTLGELKLEAHDSGKTHQGELTEKISFLGYEFENGNVSIVHSNVQRIIARIAAKFTWYKNKMDDKGSEEEKEMIRRQFITELNVKISGCKREGKQYGSMFYYSEINNLYQLHLLDAIVKKFVGKLSLQNISLSEVQTFMETYRSIKKNKGDNYILDYSKYSLVEEQRIFLVNVGNISESKTISNEEVKRRFKNHGNRQIADLEKDMRTIKGSLS